MFLNLNRECNCILRLRLHSLFSRFKFRAVSRKTCTCYEKGQIRSSAERSQLSRKIHGCAFGQVADVAVIHSVFSWYTLTWTWNIEGRSVWVECFAFWFLTGITSCWFRIETHLEGFDNFQAHGAQCAAFQGCCPTRSKTFGYFCNQTNGKERIKTDQLLEEITSHFTVTVVQ